MSKKSKRPRRGRLLSAENMIEIMKVRESVQEADAELDAMGVPRDALGCLCANEHMWMTIGSVPDTFVTALRAETEPNFDADEFDTKFYDPNGRWCPQCGEPDTYCAKTFKLMARDPSEVRPMYAVVTDDGGTVYVDRRLGDGAAAQEN